MGFVCFTHLPGVYHIGDALGVFMTLLVGERRALLVDTGYGLEDVAAFVRTLTDKPLTVMLTHAHYDHALGARWFPETVMLREDLSFFARYTDTETRLRILSQAHEARVAPEDDFLRAPLREPLPLREGTVDLGGMTAQIVPCPGHTPGSAAVLVPERRLLLTGDAWNPCTWVFFPEALPVREYRQNARSLLGLPFEHVLCPHREALYPRGMLDSFLSALTDEALLGAQRVQIAPYERIDTARALLPGGQELVFDRAKAFGEAEGAVR